MNASFDARVIAVFGRNLLVRDAAGRELEARTFGKRLTVVCGDEVRCEPDARHGEIHVVEGLPRRSALYRSNARGGSEPIVANLSQLLIVLAPRPAPDLFVVDRYIAAAESGGVKPILVLNKCELDVDDTLRVELGAYRQAGYEPLNCSVRSKIGIEGLLQSCSGQVSALVGQSGVGKSSLVKQLVPDAEIVIGALARDDEGKHTTTASRMFDLPLGGQLVDSPGVRDFAPAIAQLEAHYLGFVEVERLAVGCRFADCKHLREPGCAVRGAAESGGMHPRRYESYRRLRRLYEDLTEARGPGKKS
jgi:ribosome biogenesis GTPase / thiamine phosphate phosphatase